MLYIMKSGYLFPAQESKPVVQIKNVPWSQGRIIHLLGRDTSFMVTTENHAPPGRQGDVRYKVYFLKENDGEIRMRGNPAFAEYDDPDINGWPVCRLPKVDHANITMSGNTYCLNMVNNQYYTMQDEHGHEVLHVLHRGITGGWEIQVDTDWKPETVGALFLFCRYLEQENEFLVV